MTYKTGKRGMILELLSKNPDRALSIDEICESVLGGEGGKSTVYRLVARLSDEGAVRRYAREEGRGYTYQYLERQECHSHLHLRCSICGRVIHLSEEISRIFAKTLLESNQFQLDDGRTLLFGRCDACHNAGKE